MIQGMNLGFPQKGAKRELKFAVERFWVGQTRGISVEQRSKLRRNSEKRIGIAGREWHRRATVE